MPRLVKPSVKYKNSYLAALKEFESDKINREPAHDDVSSDFASFVKNLRDREKGKGLPKGWVPATTYWLVEGPKFIGRVSIRHKLTSALKKEGGHIGYAVRPTERRKGYGTRMLKMGLARAKKLGLKDVLLTCDWDNLPSKKMIEGSGGRLDEKSSKKTGKPHFWIDLK